MKQNHPIIFILGSPRSGTTMMGRILGNNPLVCTFKELHFFEKLSTASDIDRKLNFQEAIDLASRLCFANKRTLKSRNDYKKYNKNAFDIIKRIPEDNFFPISIYTAFLKYTTEQAGKKISCEQTPGYVFYLKEILSLYPNAKIINMVRDPRDVILSQKKRWKRYYKHNLYLSARTWMNYNVITTSKLWTSAINNANAFKHHERVCFVKFENILENPEHEVQKICDFIGIDYSDNMLNVPMTGSSLIPDTPEKKIIDKTRTLNWIQGLNQSEIFFIQKIALKNMKQNDYQPVKAIPNLLFMSFYFFLFPVKLFFAMFFHSIDIKDLSIAIKRRIG